MSDETRRARPATQYGPTAERVAANVQRLRKSRGLSIYQLSALLKAAERPITPAAVGKIERLQRQVTVDDLAALAVILGVSPSALLLPLTREGTAVVTGAGEVPASTAWEWADGERPLVIPHGDQGQAQLEYRLWGRPPYQEGEPLEASARHLWDTVEGRRSFADNLEASGQEVQRYPDGTVKSWRKPEGEWVGTLPHVSEEGA
ncbi:helix-turn-helix domain-containing protein [Streptomyces sp. NPDC005494]|uniref:helix-turn-helix domain-containing protein n=1 Tax=Streptomyces sp. NPDC005494 TaxID=3364715 RepID=UPI0036AD2D30